MADAPQSSSGGWVDSGLPVSAHCSCCIRIFLLPATRRQLRAINIPSSGLLLATAGEPAPSCSIPLLLDARSSRHARPCSTIQAPPLQPACFTPDIKNSVIGSQRGLYKPESTGLSHAHESFEGNLSRDRPLHAEVPDFSWLARVRQAESGHQFPSSATPVLPAAPLSSTVSSVRARPLPAAFIPASSSSTVCPPVPASSPAVCPAIPAWSRLSPASVRRLGGAIQELFSPSSSSGLRAQCSRVTP